jgi:signal transduction histidine kinase
MNLATNARDAMPQGGTLTIETYNVTVNEEYASLRVDARTGNYVLLAVTDTGVGMSAETLQHAFEPFFTTKPHGKGTGLGLASVCGIIRRSDGWIWVDSKLGLGTTFKIYLPRATANVSPAAGKPAQPRTSALDARGGETLLVVEDQSEVRKLAIEALKRYGYHVLQWE